VAAAAQLPFVGVWLEAPESVLIARSEQRRLDASDADADVIRRQVRQDTGAVAWSRVDASGTSETVLSKVTALLHERLKTDAVRIGSQAA
jgi:hypothetical protein